MCENVLHNIWLENPNHIFIKVLVLGIGTSTISTEEEAVGLNTHSCHLSTQHMSMLTASMAPEAPSAPLLACGVLDEGSVLPSMFHVLEAFTPMDDDWMRERVFLSVWVEGTTEGQWGGRRSNGSVVQPWTHWTKLPERLLRRKFSRLMLLMEICNVHCTAIFARITPFFLACKIDMLFYVHLTGKAENEARGKERIERENLCSLGHSQIPTIAEAESGLNMEPRKPMYMVWGWGRKYVS